MSNGRVIKEAVIVLGVEQGQVSVKLPDLAKIIKQNEQIKKQLGLQEKGIKALNKARTEENKRVAESAKRRAAILKNQANAQDKVAKAAARSGQVQVEAARRAAESQGELLARTRATQRGFIESSQQVGEGLFTVARGFTLLGFEGDESFEKIARGLAHVQGSFDLFRGVSNTIKGVIATTELLSTAGIKNTSVVSRNTAATTANTVAKKANKAASVSLAAALGPVGLAAAATTTALFAALEIRRRLTEQDQKLAQAERGLANALSFGGSIDQRKFEQRLDRRQLLGLRSGAASRQAELEDARLSLRIQKAERDRLVKSTSPTTKEGQKALAEERLRILGNIQRERKNILQLESRALDQSAQTNATKLSDATTLQSLIQSGSLSGSKLSEAQEQFRSLTGGKSLESFEASLDSEQEQKVERFNNIFDRLLEAMEDSQARIVGLETTITNLKMSLDAAGG